MSRTIGKDGYVYITINDKLVREHRYIMEQHIGRSLSYNEVVHHINGNKSDNRLSNLEIKSRQLHAEDHGKEHPAAFITLSCSKCNTTFQRLKRYYKRNVKLGITDFYCSRSCQLEHMQKVTHKSVTPPAIVEKILEMKRNGMTGYSIANMLGLYKRTVYFILERNHSS